MIVLRVSHPEFKVEVVGEEQPGALCLYKMELFPPEKDRGLLRTMICCLQGLIELPADFIELLRQ